MFQSGTCRLLLLHQYSLWAENQTRSHPPDLTDTHTDTATDSLRTCGIDCFVLISVCLFVCIFIISNVLNDRNLILNINFKVFVVHLFCIRNMSELKVEDWKLKAQSVVKLCRKNKCDKSVSLAVLSMTDVNIIITLKLTV